MHRITLDRRHCCPVMATLAATGAIGLAAGSIDMDHPLFAGSLALFLVAMSVFIALRTGVTAAMLERARQDGYDDGYNDGREAEAESPVVPRPVRLFPIGGATHQLREKGQVGS